MTVVNEEKQHIIKLDRLLSNATAMADALEYYLIEGNVFRTVMVRLPHGLDRVTMSMGELLTSLNILQAKRAALTEQQALQLSATLATVARAREQFNELFHNVVVREIMARLDSINWFLHDCENHRDDCQTIYPAEIRNRQRIEEIVKALGDELTEDVTERIDRIDQRVRAITYPTDFIWPQNMREIYPPDPYWYLYLLPK